MTSTAREDGTRDQMCSDKVQESDSQCINTATSALWISLPYLEISPQCNAVNRRSNSNNMCQPDLTAAFVKIQLIRATRRAHLLRGSDNGKGQKSIIHFIAPAIISSNVQQQRIASQLEPALTEGLLVAVCQGKMADEDSEEDLLCFPTNDPTNLASWPCKCRGFARSIDLNPLVSLDWEQRENQRRRFPVIVTDSTLVRVLPCYHTQHCGCNNAKGMMWKDQLTGDTSIQMDHNWVDGVFATHNSKTTLPDLTLRMQRLLTADPVNIGTTANALEEQALRKAARLSRERKINVALRSLYTKTEKCGQPTAEKISEVRRPTTSTLFRDGALLVHSPDHGDGKTALVQSIAQCRLGFRGTTVAVHVIRLVAVMARYGVHADTALQCTIHAIAMQSAVRNRPVCIILDGLEAIISPLSHQQSASSSLGDASLPVLLGIRSYIQILSLSLQQRHEIPFPSNNPLYNWTGDLGSGTTLPLHLCLVGIMTCPDRQWNGSTENAIFPGAMGVYRLPNLTSATRCAAFRWAFASHGITMGKDLEDRLPFLSASAIWARGAEFQRVAHRIRSVSKRSGSDPTTVVASLNDAAWVFAEVSKTMKKGSDVQFMASAACENIFDTVGGNKEAKTALEEALALDVDRRNLLASFGLKPATGILLYGPPGTGKKIVNAICHLIHLGFMR